MRFKHLASREYLTVVPFGLACDVPAFKHEGVGPKPIHLSNVTEHVSCFFVCLFICSLFVYSYVRLLISLFVCLFVCLFIRLTGECPKVFEDFWSLKKGRKVAIFGQIWSNLGLKKVLFSL